VIVNQATARRYWHGADPVGSRITFDGTHWLTVVGVVGDVRQNGLHRDIEEQLYRPLAQAPITGAMLVVRTTGDPLRVAARARAAVAALDPRVPVDRVRTLVQVRDASVAPWRLVATLLGLFARWRSSSRPPAWAGRWPSPWGSAPRVRRAHGARRHAGAVLRGVLRQGVTLARWGSSWGSGWRRSTRGRWRARSSA
jgi:hypothetical protein